MKARPGVSARYTVRLTWEEYQAVRKASMTGGFVHKFTRTSDEEVVFSTNAPNKMADDLEKIIDSGATSWREILGF